MRCWAICAIFCTTALLPRTFAIIFISPLRMRMIGRMPSASPTMLEAQLMRPDFLMNSKEKAVMYRSMRSSQPVR